MKCNATGQNIRPEKIDSRGKAKCPYCGKPIKPRLALGGYNDERPRYYYIPYHKRKI
jgi:NAD-dependent SIR2 family protein deacetylase